ncbi:MAG: hypothetical protein AB1481_05670 [Candidatus Omnitrophota bacterium]
MRDKIAWLKIKIKSLPFIEGISTAKLALGCLAVLLLGFLLYQSLVNLQLKKLKAASFQFNSQAKLLTLYQQIMADEELFINEARQKEKRLQDLISRFIHEEELSDYFTKFRALVKLYNLEVVNLNFKPQETIKDEAGAQFNYFQRLWFEATIRGGYFDVMSFIYRLEQNKPIFDIKSLKISQENPQGSTVILSFNSAIYILMKKN